MAAGIRIIPEIKAGVWPIGYDTFNTYAPQLATYHSPLIYWLFSDNLIYFIFLPFVKMGVDPGFLMKIFGPIFFGFLILSFYYWARFFVKFDKTKALLVGVLIIFQLATLRLSWDLYRNELGLIFFFWALINLLKIDKNKNLIYFALFSLLLVLSHELVTVIFTIVIIAYGINLLLKRDFLIFARLIIPFFIVSLVFLSIILLASRQNLYNSNIFFISEQSNNLWRYLYEYQKDIDYTQLLNIISRLFWLFYEFLLPLALYGFWLLRKNLILTTLTLWLLIGTFSSLIFAGTGIIVWERWLVMLVFPFAIYTVEGIFHIGQFVNLKLKKWHLYLKPMLWVLAVIFWFAFLVLSFWRVWPFLTASYPDAKPPFKDDQLNSYFPATMVHNSVGIWRIEDTLDAVEWLDKNVPPGAVVLVDNRYRGLFMTNFEMDNRYVISNTWSDSWSKKGLSYARGKGFQNIYLIWKNTSIKNFDRIYVSGNMAVYKAKTLND